jgi:hypothetical protein
LNYDEAGVEATESTSIVDCTADVLATTFLEANSASWALTNLSWHVKIRRAGKGEGATPLALPQTFKQSDDIILLFDSQFTPW